MRFLLGLICFSLIGRSMNKLFLVPDRLEPRGQQVFIDQGTEEKVTVSFNDFGNPAFTH